MTSPFERRPDSCSRGDVRAWSRLSWFAQCVLILLLLTWLSPNGLLAQEPPALIVDASPSLASLLPRLKDFDRERLKVAMRLVGLSEPQQPVTVVLAEEGSRLAQQAPPWASGYAQGRAGFAVILPTRIPNYPDDSLEGVVQHEITHVLIDRAARFHAVPRWFHEGVAMASARVWSFEDRSQLAWGVILGGPEDLAALDEAFRGNAAQSRTAYALAAALVRDLLRDRGPSVTGDILRGLAADQTFAAAFEAAAGEPLALFEKEFFRRQALWLKWIPFLTSTTVLWIGISLLAVWAFRRRKRLDARIAERWEAEERAWRVEPVREPSPEAEKEELVN